MRTDKSAKLCQDVNMCILEYTVITFNDNNHRTSVNKKKGFREALHQLIGTDAYIFLVNDYSGFTLLKSVSDMKQQQTLWKPLRNRFTVLIKIMQKPKI